MTEDTEKRGFQILIQIHLCDLRYLCASVIRKKPASRPPLPIIDLP